MTNGNVAIPIFIGVVIILIFVMGSNKSDDFTPHLPRDNDRSNYINKYDITDRLCYDDVGCAGDEVCIIPYPGFGHGICGRM